MTDFVDFESAYAWYDSCGNFENEAQIPLLPWWMRGSQSVYPHEIRGWFTDSYPVLHPYYPMAHVNPDWIGAWDPFLHDGYWWG